MLDDAELMRIKKDAYKKGRVQGLAESKKAGIPKDFTEAFVESYAEGYAKGFVEGFVKGYEKGTRKIIKNLLIEKASLDLISKVSGWTKEKILEFAKSENITLEEN